nr:hypothetical protein [Tanacetum cinerariifolium]
MTSWNRSSSLKSGLNGLYRMPRSFHMLRGLNKTRNRQLWVFGLRFLPRIRDPVFNDSKYLLSSIEPANVAEALRDTDWTVFLNGILKEEVYVGQPSGFVSKQYPDHVYALDKALYVLKQVPRAWYEVLLQFLIDSDFQKGSIDTTLFIKKKYILDILKRFGMENCDTFPTPMVEQAKLKLDLVGKPVDHTNYRSMIGSLMYVTSSRPDIMFANCDKLVCWSSKKQNCVSISTAESEYVAVSSCCAQVLWMHTQLTFFYDKVPIYCDSNSAIVISCSPIQHTRTKHIDVRIGIDLPWSLPSNLGKLGLGDGV